jgi:hypothetical protein
VEGAGVTSLYKRATPIQAWVIRVVEGSIRDAQAAHPHLKVSENHRRSIAKRAAGTISARLPGEWAAPRRSGARLSDRATDSGNRKRQRVAYQFDGRGLDGRRVTKALSRAGKRLNPPGAPPLLGLAIVALKACVGPLLKADDRELADAMINVMAIVGRRRKAAEKEADALGA